MYPHHEESIQHMTAHYRENPDIQALFLIGSVATGTERPDSDLDGVAVVPQSVCDRKKQDEGLEEVYYGKCTYEGGYFNIHYMSREDMERIAVNGSEPARNMFSCARVLFCDDPQLPDLAAKITVYPQAEAEAKQLRLYCTFKMMYTYYWRVCRPEGFMRHHVADAMVYNLYRLILIENQVLFPSLRKLEETVTRASRKPEGIVQLCHRFLQAPSDEGCRALIDSYESWASYDYPKDHKIVMNHCTDPYEWQ